LPLFFARPIRQISTVLLDLIPAVEAMPGSSPSPDDVRQKKAIDYERSKLDFPRQA